METIGQRLNKIIEKHHGSAHGNQKLFCKTFNVSEGLLSHWLTGKRNPSEKYRRLICAHYKISRPWLDSGEGDMDDVVVLNYMDNRVSEDGIEYSSENIDLFRNRIIELERERDKLNKEVWKLNGKLEESRAMFNQFKIIPINPHQEE